MEIFERFERVDPDELMDADFWNQLLLEIQDHIVDFYGNPPEGSTYDLQRKVEIENYKLIKEALDSGKLPYIPSNETFAMMLSLATSEEEVEKYEREYKTELGEFGKNLILETIRRNDAWRSEAWKYEKIPIPASLREDVLQRDKFTCQHCGRSAPNVVLHVDHIIPESKDGPTNLDNLQVLCQLCNIGKSNRYDD